LDGKPAWPVWLEHTRARAKSHGIDVDSLPPNREGAFLKEMLGGFTGVLVSDFYAVYDALACPQQKCLIHLIRDLNQEVLNHSQAYATLKEATSTIGHRLTGSSNGHQAEEYTYQKFKEYGFEDVRFQEFEIEAWSRDSVAVKVKSCPYTDGLTEDVTLKEVRVSFCRVRMTSVMGSAGLLLALV